MLTPSGIIDQLGDDVTAEYVRSELVAPIYLYDLHYDDKQPPYLLTSRANGYDVTLRYYDNVTTEARRYMPWPIEHGDETLTTSGQISENELRLSNKDNIVQALFRGKALNGRRVVIRQIYDGETEIRPYGKLQWEYRADGYSARGATATISLSCGVDMLGATVGRVMYKSCPWQFKSLECRYRGDAERCPKTFSGCKALGNLRHFGGFPGLDSGNRRTY